MVFVGLAALWAFVPLGEPGVARVGTNPAYAAGAPSVTATAALKLFTRVWRVPAGAATLVVGLGRLGVAWKAVVLSAGITIPIANGSFVNRLAGAPDPVWTVRQ